VADFREAFLPERKEDIAKATETTNQTAPVGEDQDNRTLRTIFGVSDRSLLSAQLSAIQES
jgi:hypothetical protein